MLCLLHLLHLLHLSILQCFCFLTHILASEHCACYVLCYVILCYVCCICIFCICCICRVLFLFFDAHSCVRALRECRGKRRRCCSSAWRSAASFSLSIPLWRCRSAPTSALTPPKCACRKVPNPIARKFALFPHLCICFCICFVSFCFSCFFCFVLFCFLCLVLFVCFLGFSFFDGVFLSLAEVTESSSSSDEMAEEEGEKFCMRTLHGIESILCASI